MAKIGILNLVSTVNTGGVFQYIMSLIEGLKNNSEHEYLLFYGDPEFRKFCSDSQNCRLVFILPDENKLAKIGRKLATLFDFKSPFLGRYSVIKENKIDILINPVSSSVGFHLGLPYIVVIYDVMHRYYPGFPEYSLKARITRDLTYKRAAEHSIFTVVDSNQTKEDLVRFYKIRRDKIRVIPSCPPWYISKYKDLEDSSINEMVDKYRMPEKFIFYPAQFWYHKNHIRLIEALYFLREQYRVYVPAVFVGSQKRDSKGTLSTMAKLIKKLKMQSQIFNLGYLSEKEVVALYKKSIALVFPSLIGPTNIPIWEAMALGTPVLCSNLFSMPEQIGDAGLLFDPFNVEDMAKKIHRIWTDENLRQEFIQKGYERIKDMTLENYAKKWEKVISEALER
jgi:glycosyltransferase involved in cell wall biosynthesis